MTQSFRTATLLMAGLAVFSQTPNGKGGGTSVRPISKLQWLIGGLWIAHPPKEAADIREIVSEYNWADGQNAIEFKTRLLRDAGGEISYTGRFYWDGNITRKLMVSYAGPDSQMAQGTITVNGDLTEITFRGPGAEGSQSNIRVLLTKTDAQHYTLSMSERSNGGWSELITMSFMRTSK